MLMIGKPSSEQAGAFTKGRCGRGEQPRQNMIQPAFDKAKQYYIAESQGGKNCDITRASRINL